MDIIRAPQQTGQFTVGNQVIFLTNLWSQRLLDIYDADTLDIDVDIYEFIDHFLEISEDNMVVDIMLALLQAPPNSLSSACTLIDFLNLPENSRYILFDAQHTIIHIINIELQCIFYGRGDEV